MTDGPGDENDLFRRKVRGCGAAGEQNAEAEKERNGFRHVAF
jgi:hypothetical protein